jgi:tRNA(fMet)-specific endonuclease VapC
MALFVLDTDILTLLERGNGAVVANVAKHAPEEIAISIVTVEEQLSGWYTAGVTFEVGNIRIVKHRFKNG